MAGSLRLYTDADVHGPLVDALVEVGWDVVRAIDVLPEGTDDDVHFAEAVRRERVLVSNDSDMKALAEIWVERGLEFPGLIWWPRSHYERMSVGDLLAAFEELGAVGEPCEYPIRYIKPKG